MKCNLPSCTADADKAMGFWYWKDVPKGRRPQGGYSVEMRTCDVHAWRLSCLGYVIFNWPPSWTIQ